MRIKCPECHAALDLGTPKPGRYRPRCKHCGKTFQLRVSDETPAKITIGREKPAGEKSESVQTPAANRTAANQAAAKPAIVNPVAGGKTTSSGRVIAAVARGRDNSVDATVDSGASVQTKVGMAEETLTPDSVVVMPARLGGYRLIRILGRGAMGAVYEAKQVSLDRLVALKTIRDRLASNPSALARFTREAYSAAQLNHHHIVQIYDFGEDDGQHFFSMERVLGSALDEVVRKQGPLEARLAVTYVLQAARGLQHAHANGMVHRDIKPANLLLSDEGVVKVADLGLVKVPDQQDVPDTEEDLPLSRASGTQVTMMGTAVGTPAYMAPEQALDAKSVDHRADIYSLGCTLFYLLTGKPPFAASQISELLVQHASDPVPSVRATHRHVPESVDAIIRRSMAKLPADRYPALSSMITDMESFLGMPSGGVFSPSVAQADQWAANAERFHHAAPLARFRGMAVTGFFAFCVSLLVLTPWIGFGYVLMGPVGAVAAVAVSLTLESMRGVSSLLGALRAWCGTLGIVDYVYAAGAVMLVGCIALFAGCWPGLLVGLVLGSIAGAAYHFGLRLPTLAARHASLTAAEKMIRDFRVSGAEEDGVRMFVARYSGKAWGELFEAIFGVESLMVMRERALQDAVIPKVSLSPSQRWVSRLHDRAKANRHAIDQAKLSRVEQKALLSEGLSQPDARDRAWQMAAALMDATRMPSVSGGVGMNTAAGDQAAVLAAAKRQRIKAMMAEARSGKYSKKRDPLEPLKLLLGPPLRLVAGVALLALLTMGAHRAGWLDRDKINTVATSLQEGDVSLDGVGATLRASLAGEGELEMPAELPTVFGVNIASLAIAGILLLASAFVSGWRMTPFVLVAVVLVLWGSGLGIPAVGPIPAYLIAAVAGAAVMVPGAVLSEREPVAEI